MVYVWANGIHVNVRLEEATVRSRSKITNGPGSRAAGIAMAYKLIEAAQARWTVGSVNRRQGGRLKHPIRTH